MRAASIFSLLAVSACDTSFLTGPPPTIDRGTPIDEPVDEPPAPVGDVCAGAFNVEASAASALGQTRARHGAALLTDGRVLIAGGHDEETYASTRTAELFADGAFLPTGSLLQARYDFALVALNDGRALAAGGFNNDIDAPTDNGDLATLELFDPTTGQWTAGPTMPEARTGLSAVTVDDGRVLIFGGQTGAESIPTSVLVFDPSNDSLVDAGGDVSFGRTSHAAHALSDGRVLMVGGYYTAVRNDVDAISADGSAARAAGVPGARRSSCGANDADGRLLVFGGYDGDARGDVQAFDPATGAWTGAGQLAVARFACQAVELSCASLICGGVDVTSCELRDHGASESAIIVEDAGSEFSGTLTALDSERALLVGGFVGDAVSGEARVISLVAP
jgi:hypothetical protein